MVYTYLLLDLTSPSSLAWSLQSARCKSIDPISIPYQLRNSDQDRGPEDTFHLLPFILSLTIP